MDDYVRNDLLSDLPNEILKHIISFLPLNEAVRTTALSTLWRQLLHPLSLHFNVKHNHKHTQALQNFFKPCLGPDRLKISFTDTDTHEHVGFVVFATKGVRNDLRLDFSPNKHLFHLNLAVSCVPSSRFSSLKTLNLRSVHLEAAGFVSDVFSGCDALESLRLEKCSGLESLSVEAGDSLRSLAVLDCPEIRSLVASAPRLGSIMYRGVLPGRFELKNALKLEDAVLDLRDGPGRSEFECEEALTLLSSLKEAQTLTISGWLLEWMCTAGVIFGWLEFRFNKLKELNWVGSSMDRFKRDSLACFLNICPSLEKLIVEIDESVGSIIPCPYFHQHWHDLHLWMDFETVKSNTLKLNDLKMFRLSGFSGEDEDELRLIELLLDKAMVLESMIIW